ncbi:MAG: hypothetical protein IKW60_01365 [Clostridia bacterium]|nr:hypothetical protein [Clostridia bacterium]
MKRRMLALLVVTVMLVGMLPAINGFAAFAPDTTGETTNINTANWHWTYTNWGTGTHSYKQSNTVSRRGSSSLHLVHYNTEGSNEGDWTVRTHGNDSGINIGDEGSVHKISFWAKVNTLDKRENAAEADALQLRLGNKNLNVTAVGNPTNGWQYYENEFTADANSKNGRWGWIVGDGNVDVYIDDVGFYTKDGDVWSENLLEASTSPTTFMAHFDNDTDMSVVDPFATPEPTATAAPFAPSNDGDSVKLVQQETKWDAGVPGGQAHTPSSYYGRINTAVSHSGSGSLHIVSYDNPGTGSSNPAYTEYWMLRPHGTNAAALATVADTKHKVTFWAKVLTNDKMTNKATDDALQFRKNNTSVALSNMAVGTPVDGWQYYEHEFTENAAGRWGFIMSDGNVDAYIDDITFQTWNGSAYGDNLIAGDLALMGTFDVAVATPTPAPTAAPTVAPSAAPTVTFNPSNEGDGAAEPGSSWATTTWSRYTADQYRLVYNSVYSHTGSQSLHFVLNDDETANNGDMRIDAYPAKNGYNPGTGGAYKANTTYKLTFWAKVNYVGTNHQNSAKEGVRFVLQNDHNLSSMAVGEPVNGWQKYELTETKVAAGRGGFYFGDADVDIYIDSVTLCEVVNGVEGENILPLKVAYMDEDGNVARPVATPVPTAGPTAVPQPFNPSTEGDSEKALNVDTAWTYSDWSSVSGCPSAPISKVNTKYSHTGSGSMHLALYNDTAVSNDRYAIRIHDGQQPSLVLQANKKYKMTFWAKVNNNDMQDNAPTKEVVQVVLDTITNLSTHAVGEPVDGWQYYEKEVTVGATVSQARSGFWLQDGNADLYIDDVTMHVWVDGEWSENMIASTEYANQPKMTYFDTDSIVIPPVYGSNVPDLTAGSNPVFGRFKWETSAWNKAGAAGTLGGHSEVVTSEVSYSGKNSLHITYKQGDSGDNNVDLRDIKVRPMGNANQFATGEGTPLNLVAGTTYTLTLYVKLVKNTADGFYVSGPSGAADRISSTKFTDMGNGWYKYEETAAATNTRVCIGCNAGEVELYLDDVSCVPAGGTDLFTYANVVNDINHIAGTFETTGNTGWKVFTPALYTEDGTKVEDITADLSGATLTAGAALANYDQDAFTGQLIVALYKGTKLEKIVVSDVLTATKEGSAVKLLTDIEMPTMTAADAADYTVQLFVWESYASMNPLCLSTSI